MVLQTFLIAFLVSYVGSIPPGTINVSVMQLSILKKHKASIFFACAASAVEFIYAGATIRFQILLYDNEYLVDYLKIITSISLIGLGFWNIFSQTTASSIRMDKRTTGRYGFLRGMLLGILNPMTIPFWLAITTYLKNERLIEVSDYGYWTYLLGLTSGTFCLLLTVDALGKRFAKISDNELLVHKIPGCILLGLGIYFAVKLVFFQPE